ncbi:hypothetical protein MAPG_10392, partial [Magnaporthiopsis poae ATCC 64411]|uniref:Uncharacterized protein n=1 Tax=Magnaporthiopsis poae (strain ATCC 64411 / 73-15) TaxID=644358 RepID=A0A0C4ECG8_MAGP6
FFFFFFCLSVSGRSSPENGDKINEGMEAEQNNNPDLNKTGGANRVGRVPPPSPRPPCRCPVRLSVLGRDACDTDAFFPPGVFASVRAIFESYLLAHSKANGATRGAAATKLKPPWSFQKDSRMDAFFYFCLLKSYAAGLPDGGDIKTMLYVYDCNMG